jgi:hypothetical protein
MAGLFLGMGVARGQIGDESDPLWNNLGCCPHECVQETIVPDYARACQENWRQEAVTTEVTSVEDAADAELALVGQSDWEDEFADLPVAQEQDELDQLFELDEALTVGQPAAESGEDQAWYDVPATPGPEALLSVARALDGAGWLLQTLSRHLTQLAEQELARASGGNMHR